MEVDALITVVMKDLGKLLTYLWDQDNKLFCKPQNLKEDRLYWATWKRGDTPFLVLFIYHGEDPKVIESDLTEQSVGEPVEDFKFYEAYYLNRFPSSILP